MLRMVPALGYYQLPLLGTIARSAVRLGALVGLADHDHE
jgi:hypothetical protein